MYSLGIASRVLLYFAVLASTEERNSHIRIRYTYFETINNIANSPCSPQS
jgi:hypothetical protein